MHFPNAESECFVFLCIPKTRIPPIKDVSKTASLLAVKNVKTVIFKKCQSMQENAKITQCADGESNKIVSEKKTTATA